MAGGSDGGSSGEKRAPRILRASILSIYGEYTALIDTVWWRDRAAGDLNLDEICGKVT